MRRAVMAPAIDPKGPEEPKEGECWKLMVTTMVTDPASLTAKQGRGEMKGRRKNRKEDRQTDTKAGRQTGSVNVSFLHFSRKRYGRTDGRTDGQTDRPRDIPSYRDARTHLKRCAGRKKGR